LRLDHPMGSKLFHRFFRTTRLFVKPHSLL
jgi:hypothetical protein